MNTREMSKEQISAFADGELADAHVDTVLADLRQPQEQLAWSEYHHIGDVLRSEEMAFAFSDGFATKMAARLEAESVIIAPQLAVAEQIIVPATVNGVTVMGRSRKQLLRRFAMPSAAVAAAVVAVAFVAPPRQPASIASSSVLTPSTSVVAGAVVNLAASSGAAQGGVQINGLSQQGDVARDPRIDEYLMAHQRFSPSMYSSSQYARSAGFTIDSDK